MPKQASVAQPRTRLWLLVVASSVEHANAKALSGIGWTFPTPKDSSQQKAYDVKLLWIKISNKLIRLWWRITFDYRLHSWTHRTAINPARCKACGWVGRYKNAFLDYSKVVYDECDPLIRCPKCKSDDIKQA